MSTPYVRLSDADTAALAFWGQDKWRQLRDNQDSHEERIAQLLAQSQHTIIDDFLSNGQMSGGEPNNGLDGVSLYDVQGLASALSTMMGSSGDHVLQCSPVSSAATRGISIKAPRLAFRLNQEMVLFGEYRCKDVGAAAPDNILVGYSDQASATDESDCIAFLKGSSAGKWRFRVAKGGVASTTDNIGNRATWQKLRIEISSLGGTLQVRAYIDGAEIANSPFTTNIPDTVVLRAHWLNVSPSSGTIDLRLDRHEHRWAAVPVNS